MKQATQHTFNFKTLTWVVPALFGVLLNLSITRTLDAAVEGGALLKGTTLSDDSSVVPEQSATSKAIK